MALIEIVIPCYQYGHYLPDCIASLAAQSISDWRAVIIDDASPDGSVEVARRLAAGDRRISVIAHARNQGHIATYNEGIEQASAEFFLLLSADDMLAPGALARAVSLMRRDPCVVLTHGGSVDVSDAVPPDALPTVLGTAPGAWRIETGPVFIQSLCARAVNFISTPSVIVRTAAQQAAGGYRPSLAHSGDLEMWLRLALHGRVAGTSVIQSLKRVHGGNMSLDAPNTILRDYVQRAAAFEAFFHGPGASMRDAGRLHRLARRRLALLACRTSLAQAARGNGGTAAGLMRLAGQLVPAPAAGMPGAGGITAFGG